VRSGVSNSKREPLPIINQDTGLECPFIYWGVRIVEGACSGEHKVKKNFFGETQAKKVGVPKEHYGGLLFERGNSSRKQLRGVILARGELIAVRGKISGGGMKRVGEKEIVLEGEKRKEAYPTRSL